MAPRALPPTEPEPLLPSACEAPPAPPPRPLGSYGSRVSREVERQRAEDAETREYAKRLALLMAEIARAEHAMNAWWQWHDAPPLDVETAAGGRPEPAIVFDPMEGAR